MREKVVLAYSGGLDTTAIIPWLKENYDYDVVCCCIDCGQGNELDGLDERAKLAGAEKLYIEDLTDEFCDHYIVPCVQAHAVYENKYLLGTSMARPAIAKKLVEVARKENAVAICHGATGKGNDQIRFELGIKALAPDLKIIAPWRNDKWKLQSREDEIEYCRQHGIHLPFSEDNSYSRDRNIWHISHEGLELEDPANEPNYEHLLVLGTTPEKAPDEGEYVTMTFEAGVPKSVNGKEMKVSDIIRTLNALGGKHGIGIVDIVENRVVGMKSRGVYETPGGTILYEAHQQLEELILDRDVYRAKKDMGNLFSQVVYEGKWFSPLREAAQAFIESTQKYVTGEVKFKLYKGNIIKAGTTSPYSLYNESIASFTTGDMYDHHDAEGFINLFGLSTKVRAMKMLEVQNNLENPELGSRQVPFGRELYIEREDFMEEPVRKYFRMFPGNEVRLMNAYFVTCTGCEKDENGNITVIHGTYDPESKGGNSPDGRKVKGTIHWVAAKTAVKAECRLYENLIDEEKGVYNEDGSMNLNPNSLTVLKECYLEPSLKDAKAYDSFQFVRNGFFCVDAKDSKEDALVFNRIVSLKSSFKLPAAK